MLKGLEKYGVTEKNWDDAAHVVKDAKKHHADKRKSASDDLQAVCLDAAKFAYSKPVWSHGSNLAIHTKPKTKCFVCSTMGGVFNIEDRRAFCPDHKFLMHLPLAEIQLYKSEHYPHSCIKFFRKMLSYKSNQPKGIELC